MPWVGFEPMIPVFERAKTVHASGRAATVIDNGDIRFWKFGRSATFWKDQACKQLPEQVKTFRKEVS
jgi:hypothetical protein